MKDFNIESIGRKMPYKEPSEEYFNSLEHSILSKVVTKQPSQNSWAKMRYLFIATTIAASMLIGVFILFDSRFNTSNSAIESLISQDLNESIDLYLDNLSDSDIQALAAETADQDTFYLILP